MTIFEKAIEEVRRGAKFHVDFEKKSAKINGKFIIEDGKYEGDLGIDECYRDDAIEKVFDWYVSYKYSVPSERTDKNPSKYFKALESSELDDTDLMYGEQRTVAQVTLELGFLILVLNGSLTWNPEWGTYFYKYPHTERLIILRSWM